MTQSVKDLERVIRRTEMNRGQVTLLKYLYEAGDDFVPREDVVDDIRWGDEESFIGVLSAFSNRVNYTEGITENPGYEAFIEREDIGGREHFRLKKQARRAIEQIPRLLEVFDRPMAELLEGISVEFEEVSLAESMADIEEREDLGWRASTPENRLLASYWKEVGGTMVAEVETGAGGPSDWPAGTSRRQIDGVRFSSEYRDEITGPTAFTQGQLRQIVQDRHVEIIEVKQSLGRLVIGQAIAGKDMFMRDYGPRSVEPVVVTGEGDPGLEWVCRRNGIRVEIAEPDAID